MKAVDKYVIITHIKNDIRKTKGVLINDASSIRFRKAIVVSCNNDSCNKGDTILYDVANSHKTTIDNVEYLIIEAGNVAVIL